MSDKSSRREFLADAALGIAGVSLLGCFPDAGGHWLEERQECGGDVTLDPVPDAARVIEVLDSTSVIEDAGTWQIDGAVVAGMLSAALIQLANAETPLPVLLPDVTSSSRVGIKVNCLNAQCATSVPLVRALVDMLKSQLGLDGSNIVVWDRLQNELTLAGFTGDAVGAQVLGTQQTTAGGGPGYEDCYCDVGGTKTRLSRILTELTDVTVNVPVLKTHDISGITAAMKNIYGIIDCPSKFHDNFIDRMPAVYMLTPIRTRLRLHIVDALIAVLNGTTASTPDFAPSRLFVGADPCGIDRYALDLVNQLREGELGLATVDAALTGWIDRAAALGLGAASYIKTDATRPL